MARICPNCHNKGFEEYRDVQESFFNHTFKSFDSIFYAFQASWNSYKATTVMRCTACKHYGFVCPHCEESSSKDSNIKDGTLHVCKKCKNTVMIRSAEHFLESFTNVRRF
jgi:hypothetical protein